MMVLLEKSKRSSNLLALGEDQECKVEHSESQVSTSSSSASTVTPSSRMYGRYSSTTSDDLPSERSMSSGSGEGGVSITVTEQERKDKNKKHMLYDLRSVVGSKEVKQQKKYSDFQQLSEKLRKLCPDCEAANVKLPAKKLFAHRDPVYLAHRLETLDQFLNKIGVDSSIICLPIVQTFLGLSVSVKSLERQGSQDSDSFSLDTAASNEHNGEQNGQLNGEESLDLGPSEKEHATPSDFEFLQVIGKGSFGKVLLAKHRSEDNFYAVKVVSKSQVVKKNETRHIMSERNVLVQNVKHPFLIGLHYSFQTKDKLYFVLDYVNGGELFYHLQRERNFEEHRARFYAAEITSALGYLHSLNIIYRDLKPENILLDQEGHVVLTDFGLCKEGIEGKKTTATFCGTPEYLAPEVLLKQPYDKMVDWWCLGAVLYEMIFGLPPFYSRDVSEMYGNILHMPLTFKANASTAIKNFLQKLLARERTQRLGYADDAQEVKEHPFFDSLDWALLEERRIKPPYKPGVSGPFDLSHFDPEFTADPVPASVGRSVSSPNFLGGNALSPNPFEGFSYVPPAPSEQSFHF